MTTVQQQVIFFLQTAPDQIVLIIFSCLCYRDVPHTTFTTLATLG